MNDLSKIIAELDAMLAKCDPTDVAIGRLMVEIKTINLENTDGVYGATKGNINRLDANLTKLAEWHQTTMISMADVERAFRGEEGHD